MKSQELSEKYFARARGVASPSNTEKFMVFASIAQLNVACVIGLNSSTFIAVQLHIIILREAFCIFTQSIPQNIVSRTVTHSLFSGSARVNASALNQSQCFIYTL
jgi:hypothetical protein